MPTPSPRNALKEGGLLIGSWINSASPIVAELMASTGFDFLAVDVEHSPVSLHDTQHIFQAIKSGNPNCTTMVRLHGVDYAHVKRFLDAGAKGLIAPLVNTREQAELFVSACKYPPLGNRGVGFCRANKYGLELKGAIEAANEETILAVQIEHIDGVKNIDNILSVEGIDGVFLGPYDLSASMGITSQFDHPDFIAARNEVLEACKRHGIAPGIHVVHPNPDEFLVRAREGYQIIAYSLDITMLLDSCTKGLAQIRQEL
ncbi:MAG: aldolase/citrate lyase family protein [Verrucomicrobiota bacterium]